MNGQHVTRVLVSVIIPCYNHGHYLPMAIESVQNQDYTSVEIIVVDDGSTDETKTVCKKYKDVKYFYQENQGLSASRNTGISKSKGEYVAFLDADDWLLPGAVETNLRYLENNPAAAFVSGGYVNVYENDKHEKAVATEVQTEHYRHFIEYNYVGMIAAVLYRRWVFDKFLFDTSLKACEDHDLYLKVSRNFPVVHHTQKIAAYRRHSGNMSYNIPAMLSTALRVLKRQKPFLKSMADRKEYRRSYNSLYKQLLFKDISIPKEDNYIFKEDYFVYRKYKFLNVLKNSIKLQMIKAKILKMMPSSIKKNLKKSGLIHSYSPEVGKVSLGDFDRTTPFSTTFGFDRGGAIDRYYIENFLKNESAVIKGRALEIGDNSYTLLYGGSNIIQSDILHVDASNKSATFIGDISDAPQIPDNIFDCIILTQTLHLIYNFKDALRTCHRILKPGGVLLLTVPGITPIDHDEWNSTWYWSFTDKAMRLLMDETFPGGNTAVETFGNVFAAATFLYGMGIGEVSKEKLDFKDPHFSVIITVKAQKK